MCDVTEAASASAGLVSDKGILVKAWILAHRVLLGVITIIVLVLACAGYLVWPAADRPASIAKAALPGAGNLMFVDLADGQDRVEVVGVARPDGQRTTTSLRCIRVYQSAGTTVCLRRAGGGQTYEAAVLAADGTVLRTVALPGMPSRARVSASGKVVSWTAFESGESYSAPGGFATETGVLDLRTGELTESLEDFSATIGGAPRKAADMNYWGVTVSSDDRTFYATLGSGGRTWLVQGDLVTRTLHDLRPNAECPSLSPDGSKIAYKKRLNRLKPWTLAVLDLRTGQERELPGTTGIDDQAAWLDNGNLVYGASVRDQPKTGIFFVPADGSAQSRLVITNAASPVPIK
jgi:hypothetical protein